MLHNPATSLIGRLDGTTPAAGQVGERVSFSTTGVNITTSGTAQTVLSATFQPGDWEISGLAVFNAGAGTITNMSVGIGLGNNTLPGDPAAAVDVRNATAATTPPKILSPSRQLTNSAPVTVYLVVMSTFGTSLVCDGYIWARRMS
jgi:hypothetical protein